MYDFGQVVHGGRTLNVGVVRSTFDPMRPRTSSGNASDTLSGWGFDSETGGFWHNGHLNKPGLTNTHAHNHTHTHSHFLFLTLPPPPPLPRARFSRACVCACACVRLTLGVCHLNKSDCPNARKLEQALKHGRPLKKGDVVRLTLDLPGDRDRDRDRDRKASAPLFRGDKGKARLSTLTASASLARASTSLHERNQCVRLQVWRSMV